jgi:hypothetical protein
VDKASNGFSDIKGSVDKSREKVEELNLMTNAFKLN